MNQLYAMDVLLCSCVKIRCKLYENFETILQMILPQIRENSPFKEPDHTLCNTKRESNNSMYIDIATYVIHAEQIFISLRSDESVQRRGFHARYEMDTNNNAGEYCHIIYAYM